MRERIWYDDVSGFVTNDNYHRILPTQDMTLEEKLNAIVRLFIYIGLIIAVLRADYRYLFFGIIAAMLSITLYQYDKKERKKAEKFLAAKELDIVDNQICTRSTVDNPFMNPSILDIHRNDRPPACATDNDKVQQAIEKNFEARLFRDVGDLYGKEASQRQFYTVPTNDQSAFAAWCYAKGPSCKDGNGVQCKLNIIEDVHRRSGRSPLL